MAIYRKVAIRSVDGWDGMSAAEQSAYDAIYYDLETFESGEQADLVSIGLGNVVAEVYNDWPTGLETVFYFYGWTVDADNHAIITTPESERTSGIPGTGAKIAPKAAASYLFRGSGSLVILEGLEIIGEASIGLFYDTDGFVIRKSVVYDFVYMANPNSIRFENSIIIYGGLANLKYLSGATLHNCTIYSHTNTQMDRLVRGSECYNVCAYSDRALQYDCFHDCTGDYNASSDASAPGPHSLTNLVLADYEFIDPTPADGSSYNFHAAETSAIVDAGTPFDDAFVTTIAAYSDDLIGVSRANGITWDIGAFEYEVGGIQGTPVSLSLRSVVEGSNCAIYAQVDNTEILPPTLAPAGGEVTSTFDYLEDTPVVVRIRKSSLGNVPRYLPYKSTGVITADGFTDYVDQIEDLVLN